LRLNQPKTKIPPETSNGFGLFVAKSSFLRSLGKIVSLAKKALF
jgi:hypothetical protein